MTRRARCMMAATIAVLSLSLAPVFGLEARPPEGNGSAAADETAKPRFGVGWDDGIALRARLGSRWGVGLRVNPDLIDSKANAHTSSESHDKTFDEPGSVLPSVEGRRGTDGTYETEQNEKSNTRTFGLSALVYYERDFGRWFAAGPYLALSYTRQTYDRTQHLHDRSDWLYSYPLRPLYNDHESWFDVDSKHWERRVGAELGVRPVLKLHDRFILETRFGIELLSTKWTEKGTQTERWDTSSTSGGGIAPPPPVPEEIVPRQSGSGSAETTIDNSGSSTRFHAVGDHVISDFQIRFVIFL